MYKIASKTRLYSPTPIVKITLDEKGKEQEEIVCICSGKKAVGDALSIKIVELLNADELITFGATTF